jgi:hypothetical protein
MLLPVAPGLQTALLAAPVPAEAAVHGSGGQTPVRFAGETAPVNLHSFSLDSRAIYDDNVFSTNPHRVGDGAFSFSPNIALSKRSEHLKSSLDYLPSSPLYLPFEQHNRLSHGLDLGSSYPSGTHFRLSLHDSLGYQLGGFQPLAGEQTVSGPRSPTGRDRTGHTSPVRQRPDATGLDATFSGSERIDELAFVTNAKERRSERNAIRDKVALIILCLAVHGAVTWDAQSTNHFFRHHPKGFRPAEADPIMRPFAGKALMYPMANLLFAVPVDLLLFKTRHDPEPIRALIRVAAIAWVGLEVQQSIVNMRNEHIHLAPVTGPAKVIVKTR